MVVTDWSWDMRNFSVKKTFWQGFALCAASFNEVTLLHMFLLSRWSFGRAKWPRRQRRREPSGKNLSGCPPILPENLKGAGGDTVVESKMAEVWQLPKYRDNVSQVRAFVLMRPRSCCASSWQPIPHVFRIPALHGMIHRKES